MAYRMLGSTGETDDAMQEPLEEPDVRVPDPIVGREDRIDPEHEALLADSVGRRS